MALQNNIFFIINITTTITTTITIIITIINKI